MSKPISTTKSNLSPQILKKRAARILAVQCVYSIDIDKFSDKTPDEKILDMILMAPKLKEYKLSKPDEAYFISLVRLYIRDKDIIVGFIAPYLSKEWRFERLAKVIQAILKIAAVELRNKKELEPAIIINEYLEITKFFNHEGEAGFVNTVLDKLADS